MTLHNTISSLIAQTYFLEDGQVLLMMLVQFRSTVYQLDDVHQCIKNDFGGLDIQTVKLILPRRIDKYLEQLAYLLIAYTRDLQNIQTSLKLDKQQAEILFNKKNETVVLVEILLELYEAIILGNENSNISELLEKLNTHSKQPSKQLQTFVNSTILPSETKKIAKDILTLLN